MPFLQKIKFSTLEGDMADQKIKNWRICLKHTQNDIFSTNDISKNVCKIKK